MESKRRMHSETPRFFAVRQQWFAHITIAGWCTGVNLWRKNMRGGGCSTCVSGNDQLNGAMYCPPRSNIPVACSVSYFVSRGRGFYTVLAQLCPGDASRAGASSASAAYLHSTFMWQPLNASTSCVQNTCTHCFAPPTRTPAPA